MLRRYLVLDDARQAAVCNMPEADVERMHDDVRLLELPAVLLSTITSLVVEFGYGNELSLTCRAFSLTNLLHAPAFRVQLQCELVSGDRFDDCEWLAPYSLGCTPHLAQPLLDSFPSLTALVLHHYSVTCVDQASLLSHQQLALQLQQLDLPYTTIWQPHQAGEPGEVTLDSLFDNVRLQQLSLYLDEGALMPDLDPLAQHLTWLCIGQPRESHHAAQAFTVQLGWLPQLQVLTLSDQHNLQGVLQLLPGLPRLHTLQLPVAALRQQQELDALLAATQLTSVQLGHVAGLDSSRSGAPCSWQRLELLSADLASAAYLPLHSLTHTLVLRGSLHIAPEASSALVAAAVHNLTQACKAPVEIGRLVVFLTDSLGSREMMAVLGPMGKCLITTVSIRPPGHSVLSAEHVPLLAPLCRNCEYLQVNGGSLIPSLHFWQQLVQLMPTVVNVSDGKTKRKIMAHFQQRAEQRQNEIHQDYEHPRLHHAAVRAACFRPRRYNVCDFAMATGLRDLRQAQASASAVAQATASGSGDSSAVAQAVAQAVASAQAAAQAVARAQASNPSAAGQVVAQAQALAQAQGNSAALATALAQAGVTTAPAPAPAPSPAPVPAASPSPLPAPSGTIASTPSPSPAAGSATAIAGGQASAVSSALAQAAGSAPAPTTGSAIASALSQAQAQGGSAQASALAQAVASAANQGGGGTAQALAQALASAQGSGAPGSSAAAEAIAQAAAKAGGPASALAQV
ncbi:hypothetical protein QJQ45_009462 [Haematococcus lacustris]|nr:hypothetical protein QJQ45_009462 [Haematococcus lacustris]